MTVRQGALTERRHGAGPDDATAERRQASGIGTRSDGVLALQQSVGNAATIALLQRFADDAGASLPFTEQDLRTRCYDASIADGLDDGQLTAAVALATSAVAAAGSGAERRTARENQLIFQVAQQGRAVTAAGENATARTAAIEALVDFSRAQMNLLPPLVERYREQPTPSVDEKVRVLGQLAAAVARMEFLLGSMMYQGGEWEETSNRGAMIDDYTGGSATQWCSLFTSTMWQRVTGETMRAASGYKLANPSHFNLDITYDTAEGGGFVGSASTRSATARAGRNFNPWAELRQTLLDIDAGRITDRTRVEALDTFLTDRGLRPQAGDIMVVKRGSADPHSFTAGTVVERDGRRKLVGAFQSHTTMVESFSGTTVSTIEGNADDMVRGRTYDLSNPDDVAKVIYLARPGIEPNAQAAATAQAETAAAETPPADAPQQALVTAGDLLGPMRTLNALLHRLATAIGGVPADSSAAQSVAELSPTGDTGRAD